MRPCELNPRTLHPLILTLRRQCELNWFHVSSSDFDSKLSQNDEHRPVACEHYDNRSHEAEIEIHFHAEQHGQRDEQRLRWQDEPEDAPAHLRSDNGPEFVARAVQVWLAAQAIGPLYYRAGQPVGECVSGIVLQPAAGRTFEP